MKLKYRKINIKYELKHNKELTEQQREYYFLQLIKEIKFLNYKRWCFLCL